MKRLFFLASLLLAAILNVNAERTYERAKFSDNWFVGAHTGFNSKLTHNTFFTHLNPHASVRVGRDFVPSFGIMAEGVMYFNDQRFGLSRTTIKAFDADLLAYLNMITLVRGFTGKPRNFDVSIIGGLGLNHQCGMDLKRKNDFVTRIGCDLNYVLDKQAAWRIFLEPAINYNMTRHKSKVQFNPHYAAWQLSVGVSYRFRNSDGTRTFRKKALSSAQTVSKQQQSSLPKNEKTIEHLPAEQPKEIETTLKPVPATTATVEEASVPMKVTTTVDMHNMLEPQKEEPVAEQPKSESADTTRVAVKPVAPKPVAEKATIQKPKPTTTPAAAKKPVAKQSTTAKPKPAVAKTATAAKKTTATVKRTSTPVKKTTSTQTTKKPVAKKAPTATTKQPAPTVKKPAVTTAKSTATTTKPAAAVKKPTALKTKPEAPQTQKPTEPEALPSINLTDESVVLDNRNVSLAAVAFYMRNHPRAVLQVTGSASNANAVRTALIRHFGINGSRLVVSEDASAKSVTFKEK